MATRKSTRGVRHSRNRAPQAPTESAARPGTGTSDLIEAARRKLMRAYAVLQCTRFVLLYDDRLDQDPRRPSYSDAVDVACDLMAEVIEGLDRVNLRAQRGQRDTRPDPD